MMRIFAALFITILTFMPALAQVSGLNQHSEEENLKVPADWVVRFDQPNADVIIGADPDSADLYFVNMTPGWHITTGPRAIFYHPQLRTEGDFDISTTLYLFDPEGRNREGYGLIFGGSNLQGSEQQYSYFLLRNTGDFLIKNRTGDETSEVFGWTTSENINIYDNPETSSVKNVLRVKKSGNEISFYINGGLVHTLSTDDTMLYTDGMYGLRVNHAVNLHVEYIGKYLE